MRTLLILLGLGIITASCEKIVAEDITAETPVLILPTVNDTVGQNPVHFKWEEMEGASKYHLEIVSPSFAAINQFVLDSVITGTDFYFELDSNEYELKLTAQNGGYESEILGPLKFWVGVASIPVVGGSVVLTSPSDQIYENGQFSDPFTWSAVSGATSYEFSLREGSSFPAGIVVDDLTNISTLNHYVPTGVLIEGEYFWGVKAYVGGVETPFTIHQLFIDDTDPNLAVLSTPNNFNLESAGVITFTWANGTDPGTIHAPVTSFVEVATDVSFATIEDSISVTGNTTTFNLTTPGNYFWRVTNTDEAGNTVGASVENEFTVN